MQIEREARKAKSVPLTPLIDVVFLLLVFFMLSSTFTNSESLELMLPQASGGGTANQGRLLQVFVSQNDTLYLGRKPVTKEQLVTDLRNTFAKFPDVGVLLLSGPRVSVQQMVTVMDHIYQAGSTNLSVASWEPEQVSPEDNAPPVKEAEGDDGS
jgi:biopolymer transport protein ExbD